MSSLHGIPNTGMRFAVSATALASNSNCAMGMFRYNILCSSCLNSLGGRRICGLGSGTDGVNGCTNLHMNSIRRVGGGTNG